MLSIQSISSIQHNYLSPFFRFNLLTINPCRINAFLVCFTEFLRERQFALFSGIVEEIGRLESKKGAKHSFRIVINAKRILEGMKPGDSVSVDGVCLTVEKVEQTRFIVFASPETVSRTTLAEKQPGSMVNLEPALNAGGRLHGHFVPGHVDGVATISNIEKSADAWNVSFDMPSEIMPYCVLKGSIAIDGISLTIAGIKDNRIEVAVIPFTWENTTLKNRKTGDPVNVEADIFARYVRKFLEPYINKEEGVSEDLLRKSGFMKK